MNRRWWDIEQEQVVTEEQLYSEYLNRDSEYADLTFEEYIRISTTAENSTLDRL